MFRWCGGRWNPSLQLVLRPPCCVFFPWHQTSGKVFNFSFPWHSFSPSLLFFLNFLKVFQQNLLLFLVLLTHSSFWECPLLQLCYHLRRTCCSLLPQAAITTAWEEKDPPSLQQDFSPHFVTPCLPESLERGRASVTVFYAAWPLVQTNLNLRLPGPCCKDTVLLCYLPPFYYQFLPPLISSLQQEPICPAFFPWCGQMNAIDLPSPAPTVPWEPLSKWLSQTQPSPGAVALPVRPWMKDCPQNSVQQAVTTCIVLQGPCDSCEMGTPDPFW